MDILQTAKSIAADLMSDLKTKKIPKIDIDIITDACQKARGNLDNRSFEYLINRTTRYVVASC